MKKNTLKCNFQFSFFINYLYKTNSLNFFSFSFRSSSAIFQFLQDAIVALILAH